MAHCLNQKMVLLDSNSEMVQGFGPAQEGKKVPDPGKGLAMEPLVELMEPKTPGETGAEPAIGDEVLVGLVLAYVLAKGTNPA